MIKKEFSEIYEKFKLNFYRNIYLETEDSENNGFDLTITESFCLEVIKSLKNATVRDVAKFMRTSQPNAAYKVANLAKKGYVTKTQSEQDKRTFFLEVTDKYYDYSKVKNRYIDVVVDRAESSCTPEEIETFRKILNLMNEELMPEIKQHMKK